MLAKKRRNGEEKAKRNTVLVANLAQVLWEGRKENLSQEEALGEAPNLPEVEDEFCNFFN